LLDIAAETGIVGKNGSYYAYGDESLGQGRERSRALLIERGPGGVWANGRRLTLLLSARDHR
jgi:hypothetical protein